MNDPQLSDLLRRWTADGPRPGFDAGVYRRLHEPPPAPAWRERVQPAPILSAVAAMLIAAAIGFRAAPRGPGSALLDRGTISGAYVSLASGEMK